MKTICWLLQLLLLIATFVQSSSLSESNLLPFNEDLTTNKIISSTTEGLSKPQKSVQLEALLKQQLVSPESGNDTVNATRQRPCQCAGGICGCCSRILYDTWNQKACVNITYDPDEFSFTANILMNDRVLYTRTISGKCEQSVYKKILFNS